MQTAAANGNRCNVLGSIRLLVLLMSRTLVSSVDA